MQLDDSRDEAQIQTTPRVVRLLSATGTSVAKTHGARCHDQTRIMRVLRSMAAFSNSRQERPAAASQEKREIRSSQIGRMCPSRDANYPEFVASCLTPNRSSNSRT